MRSLLALIAAAVLAGCSRAPVAPSAVDEREAVLSELRTDVAAVAAGQRRADADVNDVLELVRAIDEAVPGLAEATTLGDTLTAWQEDVHPRVEAASVEGLRDGYLAVAADIDAARQTLASARQPLDDPWAVTYLDAQDVVLLAVRDYARTADQLAQLLIHHWPTYTEVDARVVDFAGRRGNYRDTQEATDALAVELDTILDDLAVAETQIAEYRTRRTAAGQTVNDATADAVSVYEQRPVPAGG